MNVLLLKKQLQEFFLEDIGTGDLSCELLFQDTQWTTGTIIAKEEGVISGLSVVEEGFKMLHSETSITAFVKDGEKVNAGQKLFEIHAPVKILLSGERVILNLIQRMSGIATLAKKASELAGPQTKICDTRKTTPGLRMIEKYAVVSGGGYNHRFGLYDGVMLKENHIAQAGGIKRAVEIIRQNLGSMVKIEVETETEEQVIEAAQSGADLILFDNCSPEVIKEWKRHVPDTVLTEASGGIGLDQLEEYGKTGVDFISLGFLTHSVKALDISMIVEGAIKGEYFTNLSAKRDSAGTLL